MKLHKDDLLIELGKEDDIKEAFLLCSKNNLVFPFLPIFQADCENLFIFSFFTEKIFDFPASHYITGFEISYKGQKIKYGGKVHITNTGINIKALFFSIGMRKILGKHSIYISPDEIRVEKLFTRLIPKSYIIYGTAEDKSEEIKNLSEIKIYPKYIFKNSNETFFFIPSKSMIRYKEKLTKSLPEESIEILERIPYKKIKSVGGLIKNDISEFTAKQTRNFALVIEKDYQIPLYYE